jgi:FMN phosphatase YigB (HAD superfamily)
MHNGRPKALLLDLDDTLIDNAMDTFIPAYFRALETFVAGMVEPGLFIQELLNATRAMDRNDGADRSNQEVFASHFYPALGVDREKLEPLLAKFYAEAFPQLERLTSPRPAAPKIVEWAKGRGMQVVIATNPLFPRTAIEQRMAWGGVGIDRFEYELVTCYENSRATKSSPAYFKDIVEFLGRQPDECLMVGDNWGWDVVCAGEAGLPSYWIAEPDAPQPEPAAEVVGQGNLDGFFAECEDGSLEKSCADRVDRGPAV